MDKLEFISLCKQEPFQNTPLTVEQAYWRVYNEEENLQRQCWEVRWRENIRAINIRNYKERPEDYRDR